MTKFETHSIPPQGTTSLDDPLGQAGTNPDMSGEGSGVSINTSKPGTPGAKIEFVSCESGCNNPGVSTPKRNFVAEAEPYAKGRHSNIKRTNLVGIVEEMATIVGPAATTLLEEARNIAELPHRTENRDRLFEIVQELAAMLAAIPEPDTAESQAQVAEREADDAEPQSTSQVESDNAEAEAQDSPPATDELQAVKPATAKVPQFTFVKDAGQPVIKKEGKIAGDRMKDFSAWRLCKECVNGRMAPMRKARVLTGEELIGGALRHLHGQFNGSEPTRLFVYPPKGWVGEYKSIGTGQELMWTNVREGSEPQMQPWEIRNEPHGRFVACHRVAGFVPEWAESAAQRNEYREPWNEERDAQWHEIHLIWVPATPPRPDKPATDDGEREPAVARSRHHHSPRGHDGASANSDSSRRRRRRKRGGASQADEPADPKPNGRRRKRGGASQADEPAEPSQSVNHNGRHRDPAERRATPEECGALAKMFNDQRNA